MAFRADEAAETGLEKTKRYLLRSLSPEKQAASEEMLDRIVQQCGPAVEGYPSWHPLVTNHDERDPETTPSTRCGYQKLDHTRYFAHGFITCPYHGGDKVMESVEKLLGHGVATITAERLDVAFYADQATPILVRCEWEKPLDPEHLIPKSLAVPLMMEKELPGWKWAERGETWETMRPYLLGEPHGSRSSLFVSQETAIAMKKIYVAMVESGMYGPVKAR